MRDKTHFCALNIAVSNRSGVRSQESLVNERLRKAFSQLQNIQLVRNHRQNPRYGKATEERIIWRELLDLELQEIDAQIERNALAVEAGGA